MANPNIYSTTVVNLVTLGGALTTSEVALLSNAASSGHVYKIISLYVSSISSSNTVTVTANWNNAAAIGGTDYSICYELVVLSQSTVVLIDENSPIVLNENSSLGVLSSANSALEYVLTYQDIM